MTFDYIHAWDRKCVNIGNYAKQLVFYFSITKDEIVDYLFVRGMAFGYIHAWDKK